MLTADIWGGAGEHGRSCYYVACNDVSVLLDCGVKKTGMGEYPQLDITCIPKLSTVFLSHAHEDHSIALPLLYQAGYQGDIWMTRATHRQLPTYFEMWREYVKRQGGELPYHQADIQQMRYRYLEEAAAAGEWFEAATGVKACWGPSGHLPGSVWILLDIGGKRVFYSGDYTHESSLLRANLPSTEGWIKPDLAIIDAAYGDRNEVQAQEMDRLLTKLRKVLARKGHIFMPVPLYGRGQELLTLVSEANTGAKIICEAKLLQGFHALASYVEWLWPETDERVQKALDGNLIIVHNEDERAAALAGPPAIIFASDANLETPVAQEYYRLLSQQSRHAILFTGHLYDRSFGSKVWQAHHRVEGDILDSLRERCEVLQFHYKIHQGLPDVTRMLTHLQPRQTILVHADKDKTDALIQRLTPLGFTGLHSLTPGEQFRSRERGSVSAE